MHIDVSLIKVSSSHMRLGRDDDHSLSLSIAKQGLKDPIIVVKDKKGYVLADGYRRLKIMKAKKNAKIKAVVKVVPDDYTAESYARLLRISSNYHRSGFFPSQRAHYLKILSKKYGVSMAEIGLKQKRHQSLSRICSMDGICFK